MFPHYLHVGAPYPNPATVSAVAANTPGVIHVSWNEPTVPNGELPITGSDFRYIIRYKKYSYNVSKYVKVYVNTTSATITDLVPGTVYQVQVASVNSLGVGKYCCQKNGAQVLVKSYVGKSVQ